MLNKAQVSFVFYMEKKMNKKEEKINKNIEKLEEGNMNIITKVVMGIREYFKETYSDHVFRKVVSLLVVACFVLNIANLPAYAKSDKRAKDNKEKNEQVIESGKTDTSEIGLVTSEEAMRTGSGEGVGTMNAIGNMSEEEVDSIIEIDEEAGVIKDKSKGNKVVAVYNAEKEQVLGYAGQSDIVYYQALVSRKKALEKGEVSAPRKIEKLGDSGVQEEIKTEKTAEEIAEVKGTVIGEYKSEVTKEEQQQEESNIQGIEQEQKAEIEVKEETNLDIANPKLFDIKANVHMVYPNKDEVYYTDVVYIISEFSGELKPDGESTELRFFGLDELPENIMPTQIGYIERFIRENK